jgi:phosphate-selective porin OprO/OprP
MGHDSSQDYRGRGGRRETAAQPDAVPELGLGIHDVHIGLATGFDIAWFAQDDDSKQQLTMDQGLKWRDFRFVGNGRFNSEATNHVAIGVMWDGVSEDWFIRQTGIMLRSRRLSRKHLHRPRQGGHQPLQGDPGIPDHPGRANELHRRTIPILADGIKWLGYVPDNTFFWNLGAFTDWLSEGQSFSSYDYQFALRAGWASDGVRLRRENLFHIAAEPAHGAVNNDTLQLRARPESNVAPYFIDTGKFPATSTSMAGSRRSTGWVP